MHKYGQEFVNNEMKAEIYKVISPCMGDGEDVL